MNKKLILVRGLPGSGKTTKAKSIINETKDQIILFEADMFFMVDGKYVYDTNKVKDAHDWCRMQTACHLNKGVSVVVANTFTTMAEIKPYIEIAEKYGANTVIIETNGKYTSEHNVPADVIEKMKNRWEAYNADALIDNKKEEKQKKQIDKTDQMPLIKEAI